MAAMKKRLLLYFDLFYYFLGRPLIEMIDVLGKNPKKPKILATKQLHLVKQPV